MNPTISSAMAVVIPALGSTLTARRRWRLHNRCYAFQVMSRTFSKSRNIGVSVATGDLVAYLDDDAISDPARLYRIVKAFDDEVARAGGPV